MDLPKIRTVVPDAANPDGDRLVLLRMTKEGTFNTWHLCASG
jgi:tRNA (guanine37-N1)-methyltransferase